MKYFRSKRTNLKIRLEDTLARDREADVSVLGKKTHSLFRDIVRVLVRSGLSYGHAVNKAHQHFIYNHHIKQFG